MLELISSVYEGKKSKCRTEAEIKSEEWEPTVNCFVIFTKN